uniref:Antitoxin n=1 Tax=Rickettsia akari TaxID=786 RepID=A0A6N0URD8_RICAK|nr:antitoxin of toxin-antitoxin stability system [Rickettsia akari]QKR71877.1 antitoxin of toxin-antitoxin stability system [Rickettsia akari]QKR71881.1 antitoxin of toxin-antitoxin stability system [Rickettsia akari]QKR71885.1 antitoxin of toxin-antitoxin stability system [Rickettsia akari]QKR71889.1 antitoxin of toxin-antitoxin stability system [Rickettsia akari]
MDKVYVDHTSVIVDRQKQKSVAIISLEDHHSIEETLYLFKSLKNAERLKRAINDFEENKNFRNQYSSRNFEEIME